MQNIVQCPNCRLEIISAVKSWPVTFKKPGEVDVKPQFSIGLFECSNCKSKFRARLDLASESTLPANMVDLAKKVKSIREGLIQTLNTLRLRLKTLETERSVLLIEIGELKKAAEFRANVLEEEVNQLRAEVKSLKDLLNSGAPGFP